MPSFFANAGLMRVGSAVAIAVGIFAVLMPFVFSQPAIAAHAMASAMVGSFSFTLGVSLWVFRASPSKTLGTQSP